MPYKDIEAKRAADRRYRERVKKDPVRLAKKRAWMKARDSSPARKAERKRLIQEIKQWFIEYKKTLKCSNCSEKRHYCLDFHHRDPKTKSFNFKKVIGKQLYGRDRLLEEVAKCDVLCANCHRAHHWLILHPEDVA